MKSTILILVVLLSLGNALLAQPVNDEPCGAIELITTSNCSPLVADLMLSTVTASVPLPGCATNTAGDVWFSVVVPPSGSVTITTYRGTLTDGAMAVYTAPACGGSFTLISCVDDGPTGQMPEVVLTGQVAGSTLYVRVWGYGNTTGTLRICAVIPPELPAGDCAYRLEMRDSYGDGWGDGARVDVRVNGVLILSDSLEVGSSGELVFGVELGDMLSVEYTGGLFNTENSIVLTYFDGPVPVYEGQFMTTGQIYSTSVDCMQPPPSPGDCPFVLPLCGDTLIPQFVMQTGLVAELDNSNQGCLSGGERVGIWTQFAIAGSGRLGLTIDPSFTGEDIDFAIWGPMDSLQCPPVGDPVRCSHAAQAGPTGLDTIATDLSEGTGGNRWVSALNVLAGERYIFYLSSFSQVGGPVDITWQLTDGASLACPLLPVVDLSTSATQILVGGSVNFSDLSTNDPIAWNWSFPGGVPATSNLQDPMGIVYNTAGCYDVSLTATNAFGNGSISRVCEINVDLNTGTGMESGSQPFTLLQDLNSVTVRSVLGEVLEIELHDAIGKKVISTKGSNSISLSTSSCADGAYVLSIRTETHRFTQRIAIIH